MQDFAFTQNQMRVVFGAGCRSQLGAEMEQAARRRALVLATPFQKGMAESIASQLGTRAVGIFVGAAMHTPVDVTAEAMSAFNVAEADCVVAVGGGSAIGLGKAIAWRNNTAQFILPTTYAGSEVTPILGETDGGRKSTRRDYRIQPEVVLYDAELTLSLPVAMSVASGLNAMAHAVEALYAQDRNPISTLQAVEGLKALKVALPRIVLSPKDITARSHALYGSWLCGTVLGTVGMALHHKLCHTLGGSFDLPHAETHAILLPHSAAYNAEAASDELRPVVDLFGGSVGSGLYDFAASIGAPLALKDIGFVDAAIGPAAMMAIENPYWNPRTIEQGEIAVLLRNAWAGTRPR